MTATILRKEIHDFIDTIPDPGLTDVKSYLALLFDEEYWKPVIEPADPDEIEMIEEGIAEFKANPESFRRWQDIRKEHPAT